MKSALSMLGRRTDAPPVSWLMSTSLAHPGIVSLAAGFTDNSTLPVDEVRELVRDLLSTRSSGEPALQYGSTAGSSELINLTAARVEALERKAGNRDADREKFAERLVITHGSQQLLYLVSEVLCDPGDIVIVEDPTYFVYLGIVQSHGLECRGLVLDEDGLSIPSLEKVLASLKKSGRLPRLKMVYLVSYHQNPTGTNTTFEKKQIALDILRHYERFAGHRLFLFEDAAYRELGFNEKSELSVLSVAKASERVIYAGTYSKPFATGVRIGFGLLPEPVRTAVLRVKGNHDFGTSNFLQSILARAIASGVYDTHLEVVRRRYREKAGLMLQAMRSLFPPSVHWREPRGGMYIWVTLPKTIKTGMHSDFFASALKHEVLYVPGEICYASDPTRPRPNNEMRLSYGNATPEEIEKGISRLARVIAERVSSASYRPLHVKRKQRAQARAK